MAVTFNTQTVTPNASGPQDCGDIAGGPFDNVSVYFAGGTGRDGPVGLKLFAVVNGIRTLIGAVRMQGTTLPTLVQFQVEQNGGSGDTTNTSYLVNAGGSEYVVTIEELSAGSGTRLPVTITIAGVNLFDTATDTEVGAPLTVAAGATGALATIAGYAQQMDVAIDQRNLPSVTVQVLADCGPGSVKALVADRRLQGLNTDIAGVFRNLQLPVATEYFVQFINNSASAVTLTLTADTYSAAASGGGGSPTSLTQAAWFVDPLNGNDGNTGLTAPTAIKTFAELDRRWGNGNVLNPTGGIGTVTLLNSAPPTDPLNFDIGLADNAILVFQAADPAETALPVTVVRARDRNTNTPWAITLTTAAGPFVLQRIRDVTQSTPTSAATFIGAKDEGADVLRISEPVTYPGVAAQLDPVANRFTPVNTDAFVAQTLVSFTPGAMTVSGSAGTIQFNDFAFDGPFALLASIGISPFLYGCIAPFGSFIQSGGSFLNDIINCGMAGPIAWFVGSFNEIQAGVLTTHGPPVDFIVDINCTIRLDIDVLLQGLQGGATVLTGTRWLFGTCGIFDSVPGGPGGQNPGGDGVRLTPGADGAVTFTDTDITNQIWGAGNAGRGLYVGSNATFSYDASVNAAPMSVTGTGGNFSLAGTATSSAPPVNAPTGGLADTWAALFSPATYPNGTAFDPIFNAWITPFQ